MRVGSVSALVVAERLFVGTVFGECHATGDVENGRRQPQAA
jgi:hypothetical protein